MRYEFVDTTTGEWYTWKQDSWLTSLYDWSVRRFPFLLPFFR